MNIRQATVTALLIGLAACGNDTEVDTAVEATHNLSTEPEPASWSEFAQATIDDYYRQNPETAVDAGLHVYDGQISDFGPDAKTEYVAWLNESIDNAAGYDDLEGIESFERDYLVSALESELFFLEDSGFMQNNPVAYAGMLGFGVYVDREYAPLDERLAAYTAYIGQLPAALRQMRANLEPPLPAPYVNTAHGMFAGLAGYLRDTVPGLFAGVDDEQLQEDFAKANSAAADAVDEMAEWLAAEKEHATDDYALGEEKFLQMLRENEGVDVSIAELKAAGEADLERNLEALAAACEDFAPGANLKECVLEVQGNKSPEGAVAAARRQLPMLRSFVEQHAIVSIPGTEDALVAEAPPHKRFNAAYIDIPGPFEKGLPSTYYIAPPDPSWSEADQMAYVPDESTLLAISVHEVWPGHFLQFLHANRVENNVGRHFSTYSFVEGWAHYTEQMMLDAGLGDGDAEEKIGQLLNALLRNVRYLSAIGLHTEGMSVAESQKMFEEKAFQDYGNAVQQANRGTYDPGYLNYTLGKLMINKLRDDWTGGRGGREAWQQFHDEFLSYGSPPIPLIRKQMLGPDDDGDTALLPN